MNIDYTITFHSDWHCSSGQSAGFGIDLTVIRDKDYLPFIPGKTLKGMLRDAAENLRDCDREDADRWKSFIECHFGQADAREADCHFSNGELSKEIKKSVLAGGLTRFLFRKNASTSIDDQGTAKEHSLRVVETVVPVTLFASIYDFTGDHDDHCKLGQCMQWVKRMGLNRNSGLGRCTWKICNQAEVL